MLPFGSVPFGQGYFGRGDWGRRVYWENLQAEVRERDVNGYLENLLKSWADEMEDLLQKIVVMPLQRDPYLVRASEGEEEWIYVTGYLDEEEVEYGSVIKLIEEKDGSAFPDTASAGAWTPYSAISKVGPGWTVRIGDGDFDVVSVRTRNYDPRTPTDLYSATTSIGNEVWMNGGPVLLFSRTAEVVGYGDVTVDPLVALADAPLRLAYNKYLDTMPFPLPILWYDGDPAWRFSLSVPTTGSGTVALYDVPVSPYDGTGVLCPEDGGVPGTIDQTLPCGTINYETGEVTLDITLLADTVADGAEVTATYWIRGYYFRMYPPRMIDCLALDYGFENDPSDPEEAQRSAIAHLSAYFGCKGSADSYRIRGEISWLNVVASGLWYMCDYDQWIALPAANRWTYDGLYYSDVDPRMIRFDDIAADAQYWDHDAAVFEPVIDNAQIFDDASPDGWSTGKAFCCDVVQGYYVGPPATVLDAVALTPLELLTYGVPFGYRVTVTMTAAQKAEFSFLKGRFGLSQYDSVGLVPPDFDLSVHPVYWIDAEDGWSAPNWTVIVGANSVPAAWPAAAGPGLRDVAIRYWPEVAVGDCCYCRSYRMRVVMSPTADALGFYETADDLWGAYRRLMTKIEKQLLPIHVKVVDYEVVLPIILDRVFEGHDDYEELASGEFDIPGGSGIEIHEVTLSLEQTGAMAGALTQDFILQGWDTATSAWVNVLGPITSSSGVTDLVWHDVAGYTVAAPADVTAVVEGLYSRWRVLGKAQNAIAVTGQQRWTFTIHLRKIG